MTRKLCSNVFRNGLMEMIRFLSDLQRTLGEYGVVTLNAWWQGRLVGLLREEAETRPRPEGAQSKNKGGACPMRSVDLIQGLDI